MKDIVNGTETYFECSSFISYDLTYVIKIFYLWQKSDSESYRRFKQEKKLTYENSTLRAFLRDNPVVADDVICNACALAEMTQNKMVGFMFINIFMFPDECSIE